MPATRGAQSVEERLQAEFKLIKEKIAGVHGSIVATSDGFLVAHDLTDLDPTNLAALLAASRALASQGIAATGRGEFREAITRGTLGYLAVYAAGGNAIVAVVGDSELNVGLLHLRVRDIVDRIATYTAEFRRWAGASSPSPEPAATRGNAPGSPSLPMRRRN